MSVSIIMRQLDFTNEPPGLIVEKKDKNDMHTCKRHGDRKEEQVKSSYKTSLLILL